MGAAAALDQPAVGGDLVGAVDRDVEPVEPVERLDRDARARAPDSSVATEVATQRIVELARGERRQQMGDGRARPEPDHHAVGDQLGGGLGGDALLVVAGSRPTSNPIARFRTALVRLRSMATEEQSFDEFDELAVNTIRTLAIDAIQKANSGHPGTPMALAPVAYVALAALPALRPRRNRSGRTATASCSRPATPRCCSTRCSISRGVRAVDSDYEVEGRQSITLDDIKSFRQLDSKAAGHPEYRWASGVETTTGPLGQGVATSVGMAVASKWQAAHFNRPGFELFDFDTYVICGDGDLMEGVSHEAGSFAGHQRLDNLCWIYDNNHISIDGDTEITYEDDVAAPLRGLRLERDPRRRRQRLRRAHARVRGFQATEDRPTLIIVDSHIGYGSPHKQDTAAAHGEPLGDEEVRETKRFYGWPEDAAVPRPRRRPRALRRGHRRPRRASSRRLGATAWSATSASTSRSSDRSARCSGASCPTAGTADIPSFEADEKGIATRKASNQVQNAIAANVPWLLSGSADLTDSTSVRLDEKLSGGDFQPEQPRPAASSTTGSASTSRRRSRTGSRSRSCARRGRPTSSSPTTRGPRSGSRR